MANPFTGTNYELVDIYDEAEANDLDVQDTKIDDGFYILEVMMGEVSLFEFHSKDNENYEKVSDKWDADSSKDPVLDEDCRCLMSGAHKISMHGTSPEWDKNYFWVREDV